MAAKLLWLQRQSPEIWKQTDKLCLISDYLTLLLHRQTRHRGGSGGTDGLGRYSSLPVVARDARALRDRPASAFPRSFGREPTWGRSIPRPPNASACRRRAVSSSAVSINMPGPSGRAISSRECSRKRPAPCWPRFAAAIDSLPSLRPGVFQGPAFREGLYWQMAFGDVSANYLQWYRDQLPDRPDFEQLTALAESIEPGADGLRLKTAVGLTRLAETLRGTDAAAHAGPRGSLHSGSGGRRSARTNRDAFGGTHAGRKSAAPAAPRAASYGCKSRPTCWACRPPPRPVPSRQAWARPCWPRQTLRRPTCEQVARRWVSPGAAALPRSLSSTVTVREFIGMTAVDGPFAVVAQHVLSPYRVNVSSCHQSLLKPQVQPPSTTRLWPLM